jgi:hypothetical protein
MIVATYETLNFGTIVLHKHDDDEKNEWGYWGGGFPDGYRIDVNRIKAFEWFDNGSHYLYEARFLNITEYKVYNLEMKHEHVLKWFFNIIDKYLLGNDNDKV